MKDWKGIVLAIELWLVAMALVYFAVESFVQKDFGRFALVCAGSILALVAAVYSLEKEKRKVAALSMTVFALISFCGAAVLFPVFASSRAASTKTNCMVNVKLLSLANIIYSSDYDLKYPPAGSWRTLIKAKDDARLYCESAHSPFSYAFNGQLSARLDTEVPDPIVQVMVFEADAYGKDAYGGSDWFAPRHGNIGLIGFVDGHTSGFSMDRANELGWLMPPENPGH